MKGCGAGERVGRTQWYVCNWKDKELVQEKVPSVGSSGGGLSTEMGKIPEGLEKR